MEAQSNMLMVVRPHCMQMPDNDEEPLGPLPDLEELAELGSGRCPDFPVRDPETQTTPVLQAGDTLDMDLVVYNPDRKAISGVRAWISYDTRYLEGESIEISPEFPSITPGEMDFNTEQGTIQIGVSADPGQEPAGARIPVARIKLRVKEAPANGSTPLLFMDVQESTTGHTYVMGTESGLQNLTPSLGTLLVLVEPEGNTAAPPAPLDTLPSVTDVQAAMNASSRGTASSTGRSSFVLLQVQNVRATTDKGGSTVYVAWDPLRSSELAGYNAYYGTERGRYINRHSVERESTSYAIRSLVPGTVYYIAVRGVSTRNEESSFSREVSVKVGEPGSSTAPMTVRPGQGGSGTNPVGSSGNVPGASGAPSILLLLLIGSGIIGTLFAFRRQLIASPVKA
jgi:hypothetical protein